MACAGAVTDTCWCQWSKVHESEVLTPPSEAWAARRVGRPEALRVNLAVPAGGAPEPIIRLPRTTVVPPGPEVTDWAAMTLVSWERLDFVVIPTAKVWYGLADLGTRIHRLASLTATDVGALMVLSIDASFPLKYTIPLTSNNV